MKLVYIASPYSHDEEHVMQHRYEMVRDFTAGVMLHGSVVPYSPIVHCHDMGKVNNLPKTYNFWMQVDETFIRHCDEVWVLMIDGWDKSKGIQKEIEFAIRLRIPVLYKLPHEVK